MSTPIDPAPVISVDCTIVELEPAVYDATGVLIRPPVIQLPQEYDVSVGEDYAITASGERVSLADLGIVPHETLDEWNARQQQAADDALHAEAVAVATAWVQIRMIRDRWLAQTDFVESFVNDPASFAHLPATIQKAITANADGWVAWRQALRDLPAAKGLDPVVVVAEAGGLHSTSATFSAPWPQPPAAPVVHLT
jgi:hypothetical protein